MPSHFDILIMDTVYSTFAQQQANVRPLSPRATVAQNQKQYVYVYLHRPLLSGHIKATDETINKIDIGKNVLSRSSGNNLHRRPTQGRWCK